MSPSSPGVPPDGPLDDVSEVVGAVVGETARRYRGSAIVGVVALVIVLVVPSRSPLPETFGFGPSALPPPTGPVSSLPPLTSPTTAAPPTTSTPPPTTTSTSSTTTSTTSTTSSTSSSTTTTSSTTTSTTSTTSPPLSCELLGVACP